MTPITFYNFRDRCRGQIVTSSGRDQIVLAHNPYGSHGLVLVDALTGQALRHGTLAVLCWVQAYMDQRAYRRVRRFLAARGIGLDGCLVIPRSWN